MLRRLGCGAIRFGKLRTDSLLGEAAWARLDCPGTRLTRSDAVSVGNRQEVLIGEPQVQGEERNSEDDQIGDCDDGEGEATSYLSRRDGTSAT